MKRQEKCLLLMCLSLLLCNSCQRLKDSTKINTGENVKQELSVISHCDLLTHHTDYDGKTVRVESIMSKGLYEAVFYDKRCVFPQASETIDFAPEFECVVKDSASEELCKIVDAVRTNSELISRRLKVDVLGKLERRTKEETDKDTVSERPNWRFTVEKVNEVKEVENAEDKSK